MLRTVRIEGYRGFGVFEIDLAQVNVLLGPNSSGKSSVLQAIRLACAALEWTLKQGPEPKLSGDWIVIWWDWPIQKNEAFLPVTLTEELFLHKGDEPLSIRLLFDEGDYIRELKVSLRYGRSDALRLDVRVKSPGALDAVGGAKPKSKKLSPKLAESLQDRWPIAVAIPAFYGVIREEPFVNDGRLARLLNAGEQGSVVRNLVGRLPNLKELNDQLVPAIATQIIAGTTGQGLSSTEWLSVSFRDQNGNLEIASAGTGLVALTALFSALRWYGANLSPGRPLIFLLDEPEAHLHPKLQGDTGERLAETVTNFGAQMILATHSVEMINRLGRREGTFLWSVDRLAKQPAVKLTSENEIIERLETFCDLSPFASLQLLRSKRVLFHEGKTDREILERCARARFSNSHVNLDLFRRWTFVELSSESNADAKDVLKKALEPLAQASVGGDNVRIVRVLDRDYHRKPMLGPEEGTGPIKEFDVVWSGYSIESQFLEPECLTAWISLYFRDEPALTADLPIWIQEAISSANKDEALNRHAEVQILAREMNLLTVGQTRSPKHLTELSEAVRAKLSAQPEVYQNGKKRAQYILQFVREKFPLSHQNRIRGDITDILRYAQSPTTLREPKLVPPEIDKLLTYLIT